MCNRGKNHEIRFDGAYKQEFMTVAMLMTFLILLIASFLNKEQYKNGGFVTGLRFGAMNGTANGVVNLLVMILTGTIANSILFPGVSAGGIIAGFLLATFVYKEKLSRLQLIGIISIILLN